MQAAKYAFLAWFGGSFYVTLEVFWRARSHWTTFVMAAGEQDWAISLVHVYTLRPVQ